MAFQVRYTARALKGYHTFLDLIAEDSVAAAEKFSKGFTEHLLLLADFPMLGPSAGSQGKIRKMLHSPLWVYYRVQERAAVVEIIEIRHAARRPR